MFVHNDKYHEPKEFQERVLVVIREIAQPRKILMYIRLLINILSLILLSTILESEVKSTRKDQWSSTGNRIFESMRGANIKKIACCFW